jgi:hypothetical protein
VPERIRTSDLWIRSPTTLMSSLVSLIFGQVSPGLFLELGIRVASGVSNRLDKRPGGHKGQADSSPPCHRYVTKSV